MPPAFRRGHFWRNGPVNGEIGYHAARLATRHLTLVLRGSAGFWRGGKGFGVKALKMLLSSFLVGALSIGLAYAGAVITPPKDATDPAGLMAKSQPKAGRQAIEEAPSVETTGSGDFTLQPGQVMAGAAKVSIEPRPADYGGVWEKEGCATLEDDAPARRHARPRLPRQVAREPELHLHGRLRHRPDEPDHEVGRRVRPVGPLGRDE